MIMKKLFLFVLSVFFYEHKCFGIGIGSTYRQY